MDKWVLLLHNLSFHMQYLTSSVMDVIGGRKVSEQLHHCFQKIVYSHAIAVTHTLANQMNYK